MLRFFIKNIFNLFFKIACLLLGCFCLTADEFVPEIGIFPNPKMVGEAVAQKMVDLILEKQDMGKKPIVLGLATGNSVLPIYEAFIRLVKEKGVDLSDVVTFNLDEYVGISDNNPASFNSFMFKFLFGELLYSEGNQKGIKFENIYIPNGVLDRLDDLSENDIKTLFQQFPDRRGFTSLSRDEQLWMAEKRALYYESLVKKFGPIDLQILGIGRNGHIGFSEPGVPFSSETMVVELTENTRKDNAGAFGGDPEAVPPYAITMGIKTILRAEKIFLIATGEHKAAIVNKTLKEPISPEIPASALRLHKNVTFFLDVAAASELPKSEITRYINGRVLLDHELKNIDLWVKGGKIVEPQEGADETIDLNGLILSPGFIDLQMNGGFGCDFSREPEKADCVASALPQFGVTAFLPTLVSSTKEQYEFAISSLQPRSFKNKGAAILGIHLEGPYFSPTYCGAHSQELIHPFYDHESALEMTYGSLDGVKIVTLAPEIPGAVDLIRFLKEKGIVVAAGHSNATFEEMQLGIKAGIGLVTHIFNAMRPYNHRDSGIIGSALIQPSLFYSIIADGIHVSPQTLALCYRCNPNGLTLITDATAALGLADGVYKLGLRAIELRENRVNVLGTKTLAGSALRLDRAVRNFRSMTGCSIPEALEAASFKPAKILGIYPSKGSLQVGADADFLILNDELEVLATYIGGEKFETKTH